MKLYFGCSQWGYENWKGSIYPEDAASADFLRFYSRIFNSVELNSTFYNGADPFLMQRWKNKVKEDFRFCPKVPRIISHDKNLKDIDGELTDFLSGVNVLGGNLGIIFLQLNSFFRPDDLPCLSSFLGKVPGEFPISVETRIPQLQNAHLINEILSVLKEHGAGVVLKDSIETREYINSIRLTNHNAIVRFIAYGHDTDYSRLDEWFVQILKWKDKGLPVAYFFLHFPNDRPDTGLVNYFLNKSHSLEVKDYS